MNNNITTVTEISPDGSSFSFTLRLSLADAIECYLTPCHAVYTDAYGEQYDESYDYDEDALTDAMFRDADPGVLAHLDRLLD